MAKDIYIPGLTPAKANPELVAKEEAELAEIRREVADTYVTEVQAQEREKARIIKEVHAQCRNLEGPIEITEEMKELGLEEQVRMIVGQYDLAYPLLAALSRDEDFEDGW